ncbi:MAG: hypothetical protein AAF639_37005 [Chloroflexota bacterium]
MTLELFLWQKGIGPYLQLVGMTAGLLALSIALFTLYTLWQLKQNPILFTRTMSQPIIEEKQSTAFALMLVALYPPTISQRERQDMVLTFQKIKETSTGSKKKYFSERIGLLYDILHEWVKYLSTLV